MSRDRASVAPATKLSPAPVTETTGTSAAGANQRSVDVTSTEPSAPRARIAISAAPDATRSEPTSAVVLRGGEFSPHEFLGLDLIHPQHLQTQPCTRDLGQRRAGGVDHDRAAGALSARARSLNAHGSSPGGTEPESTTKSPGRTSGTALPGRRRGPTRASPVPGR